MNAKEHSLLLYLLDGIRSAPSKAHLLIKMAKESEIIESQDINEYLGRISLCNKENILDETLKIRNEII